MPCKRPPAVATVAAAIAGTLAAAAPAAAQGRDWSKVEIRTQKLAEGIYALEGLGGNIGVCAGPDGVLLVDDQFAQLTPRIKAAVAAVSDKPVRFILNTHYHGDHVGGNVNFGGDGAVIVAQENARRRLSTVQFRKAIGDTLQPLEHAGLPVVTFLQDIAFHLNGETIRAMHVDNAHTDGDVIVRFTKANVVHMGDTFFNGRYPIIDVDAGGSLDGIIAAVDRVLPGVNVQTKVIPGHGPVTDRAGLEAYRAMLDGVRQAVVPMIQQGKTLDQIIAAHPTAPYDSVWGGGSVKSDRFLGFVFNSYARQRPAGATSKE